MGLISYSPNTVSRRSPSRESKFGPIALPAMIGSASLCGVPFGRESGSFIDTVLHQLPLDHYGLRPSSWSAQCWFASCKLSQLAAFSPPSKLRIGQGLRTERFDPHFTQRVASFRMPQLFNRLSLAQPDCRIASFAAGVFRASSTELERKTDITLTTRASSYPTTQL
jgi:hypothetical protein